MREYIALLVLGTVAGHTFGQAAPTYEARLAFALGHNSSEPMSAFEVSAPGEYAFTVLGGIFNAQNFESVPRPPGVTQPSSNRGVGNWVGSITSTEMDLDPRVGGARTPPFNFGTLIAEGIDGDKMITAIDAARGTATIAWPEGEPVAPQPTSMGNDQWVRLYRFTLTITDIEPFRDIVISATGTMVAIANWGIISQTPPEGGEPGSTQWAPASAGPPVPAVASQIVFRLIPAPGAAAVICLGAAAACRRRRRGV